MENNKNSFLYQKSHGEILDDKIKIITDQGMQFTHRIIFTLERKIRHKEFSSFKEFGLIMDELGEYYKYINDENIPLDILNIIKSILDEEEERNKEKYRYRELIDGDIISIKLVKKMRFSHGMNDLILIAMIRQCQKEGKKFENPGGKVRCLDLRFKRFS